MHEFEMNQLFQKTRASLISHNLEWVPFMVLSSQHQSRSLASLAVLVPEVNHSIVPEEQIPLILLKTFILELIH